PVFKDFLVMRYAEGETLEEWFKKQSGHENGLPAQTVLPVLQQIAEALDAMHSRTIIHRDVKPQNIIFSTQDPKLAKPWLIDFGIAQAVNTSDPAQNRRKSGTPIFMAPEQHYGKPQDARTDQYALAVTAFWLLTGHFPFDADPAEELSGKKMFPQNSLAPISPSFKDTFLRALAYDPKDRFESCGEFVRVLSGGVVPVPDPLDEKVTLDELREAIRAAIGQRTELLKDYLPESKRIAAQDSEITRKCVVYLRELENEITGFEQKVAQMRADGMREDGPVFQRVIQQHQEHLEMKLDFSSDAPPKTPQEWEMLLDWMEEIKRRQLEEMRNLLISRKNPAAGARCVLKTVDGIEYAFRWCPAGTFTMGSSAGFWGWLSGAKQHEVTLTRGFWMLETEVTQAMWQSVMGTDPSEFKGSQNPVENVSWKECDDFCEKLSGKLGLTVSLPTEAQWEYACRAGTTGAYAGDLDEMGWYGSNSGSKTHPVGQKKPNGWGIYDMHGNVWEWCSDWYDSHSASPTSDPTGPNSGLNRVNRGGGWYDFAQFCRSANRDGSPPYGRSNILGFRPVLASPAPGK
ncbi:MAG: SUMF1/EgtB/PvdO family nonheme iron enzyme, partial [Thermoguttaceae bacterium]|nr:SUMF1/EgtB/PvdO family nonheme iron enzyme [Thermoguttaceae bacterium]